jgi:hypothetical protein
MTDRADWLDPKVRPGDWVTKAFVPDEQLKASGTWFHRSKEWQSRRLIEQAQQKRSAKSKEEETVLGKKTWRRVWVNRFGKPITKVTNSDSVRGSV